MLEPTSFSGIGWIMVSGAALAAGVNQVSALVDRWRGKPSAELLEKEMQQANARITKLEAEIKQLERDLKQASIDGSERRRAIYKKIEENQVALRGDINGVHRRLDLILQKQ